MSAPTKPVEDRAEQLAREMVARCLNAFVERYDDGTAPRTPDGLIHYPAAGALALRSSVTTTWTTKRQNAALADQRRFRIDGLRWSWSLSIEQSTDSRSLLGVLPSRLSQGGLVTLASADLAGFGHAAEVLPPWVEAVLRREHDVGEKLAAAERDHEGHAFTWGTIGSALGLRNLASYIARALLEAGGFRPRLHPAL